MIYTPLIYLSGLGTRYMGRCFVLFCIEVDWIGLRSLLVCSALPWCYYV